MFITAKVGVNLEVKINKQIDNEITIEKLRDIIDEEADKIIRMALGNNKEIKIISQTNCIDAHIHE